MPTHERSVGILPVTRAPPPFARMECRDPRRRPLRPLGHVRDQPPQLRRPLGGVGGRPADPEAVPPERLSGRPPGQRLHHRVRAGRHPLRVLGRSRRAQGGDRRRGCRLERGHRRQRPGRQLRPALRRPRGPRRGRGFLLPGRHLATQRLLPQGPAPAGDGDLGCRKRRRDRRRLRRGRRHRERVRLARGVPLHRPSRAGARHPRVHHAGAAPGGVRASGPQGGAPARGGLGRLPEADPNSDPSRHDPGPHLPLLRARGGRLLASHPTRPALRHDRRPGGAVLRRGAGAGRPGRHAAGRLHRRLVPAARSQRGRDQPLGGYRRVPDRCRLHDGVAGRTLEPGRDPDLRTGLLHRRAQPLSLFGALRRRRAERRLARAAGERASRSSCWSPISSATPTQPRWWARSPTASTA